MYIVGIDPGPVVGVARLHLAIQPGGSATLLGAEALQVTPGAAEAMLDALIQGEEAAVALERFVVSARAARSSTPAGGAAAREVLALVADWAYRSGLRYWSRSAAEVKPWATNARLAAVGLMAPTTGMRHARDATRHALFAAVKTYGLPDPLSTRAGAR